MAWADLGRGHPPSSRYLPTEESPEVLSSLNDRAIASDVGLGAERVEGLCAAELARDRVHANHCGILCLQNGEQSLLVLGRLYMADEPEVQCM